MSTATSMSPRTATAGETQAEHRRVDAHPARVDCEERGDERQRPAAIDRRTRALGGFDLGRDAGCLGLIREPQLADDGLVGFGGGVDRRRP